METSKHTPGPWIVYGRDINTNEVNICQSGITNIAKRLQVANVLPLPHYDDKQAANARLIAAAPEMYEALKALRDEYARVVNTVDCVSHDWNGMYDVDAALAKAEGR